MHLGLIDGPCMSQESPVPLPKFQMALGLKILMSSGSKRETQIYFPFLSKRSGKGVPSRFPNGAYMEIHAYRAFLHIS